MWGAEHDGVVPDIMTVGKGVGGGFPLAGVISTRRAHRSQALVQSERQLVELRRQSARLGGRARRARDHPEGRPRHERRARRPVMLAQLEAMKEKHRAIGEVRGKGLLLGIELVKDRVTKEPLDREVTRALYQECLRRGLVAMTYSPSIRINPPLIIREDQALAGLAILDEALGVVLARARARLACCRARRIIGLGNVAVARPPARLAAAAGRRDRRRHRHAAPARAGRAPARLPAARWFDSAEALLADTRLDFVDICTPPSSHARLIRAALDARPARALREAPGAVGRRARRREPAGRERRLRAAHRPQLAPRADRRGAPAELLRAGDDRPARPGRLADAAHPARGGRRRPGDNWRLDPAVAGGGVLTDHGWHVFYVVQRWIGARPPMARAAPGSRRGGTPRSRSRTPRRCRITFPDADGGHSADLGRRRAAQLGADRGRPGASSCRTTPSS